MSLQEAKVTFDDFALMEPGEIRGRVWEDLSRQHRIPDQYRVTTSMWATALSHANLRVANKLMLNAPEKLRSKVGALIVYHSASIPASRAAQDQIIDMYRIDLVATRYAMQVNDDRSGYRGLPSHLAKHFRLEGKILLDTGGVSCALQFQPTAGMVYGLEPDFEHLREVYRTVMGDPDDVLRVVVGTPDHIDLPTARIDILRAHAKDLCSGDAAKCLKEFLRLVHPGGVIYADTSKAEQERIRKRLPDCECLGEDGIALTVK